MNINSVAFEKSDPFEVFDTWYEEYLKTSGVDNDAMVLSTVGQDMQPTSRIVLLKAHSKEGFTFFTNYLSHKGTDIEENPKGALLFYTNSFERQIRIQGTIQKVSPEVSDKYFESRPRESRIGAIASEQSSRIKSRSELMNKYESLLEKYKDNIPRPEGWGGYILKPNYFEFWMKGDHRLHDRVVFNFNSDEWEKYQVSP